MTSTDPRDIIKNLPANAPKWSVGVVSIISALVLSFILLWSYISPLVQKNLESSINGRIEQAKMDNTTVESLLRMVEANQKNISGLSNALSEAQRATNDLSARVTSLEKDLKDTTSLLAECETKLKTCKRI